MGSHDAPKMRDIFSHDDPVVDYTAEPGSVEHTRARPTLRHR